MLSISNVTVSEILDNVKLLLGINSPSTSNTEEYSKYQRQIAILTLYIKAVCTNILIKTNRTEFVDDLKYVAINLVLDKYNESKSDSELQSIQSMSEYDRSVNFGISDTMKAKLNMIAEKQVEDNEKLINRYRLLYKA